MQVLKSDPSLSMVNFDEQDLRSPKVPLPTVLVCDILVVQSSGPRPHFHEGLDNARGVPRQTG
jgi:hypothetical protein